MLRVNLLTSGSPARCLPVDKPWFEYVVSGFVEAIFTLLRDGTPFIRTHAFLAMNSRAKSSSFRKMSRDSASAITVLSNHI